MPAARPVAPGFSPLDEVLDLGASPYSPRLVESIVLLGTLLPFEQVPSVLAFFTQVTRKSDTAAGVGCGVVSCRLRHLRLEV